MFLTPILGAALTLVVTLPVSAAPAPPVPEPRRQEPLDLGKCLMSKLQVRSNVDEENKRLNGVVPAMGPGPEPPTLDLMEHNIRVPCPPVEKMPRDSSTHSWMTKFQYVGSSSVACYYTGSPDSHSTERELFVVYRAYPKSFMSVNLIYFAKSTSQERHAIRPVEYPGVVYTLRKHGEFSSELMTRERCEAEMNALYREASYSIPDLIQHWGTNLAEDHVHAGFAVERKDVHELGLMFLKKVWSAPRVFTWPQDVLDGLPKETKEIFAHEQETQSSPVADSHKALSHKLASTFHRTVQHLAHRHSHDTITDQLKPHEYYDKLVEILGTEHDVCARRKVVSEGPKKPVTNYHFQLTRENGGPWESSYEKVHLAADPNPYEPWAEWTLKNENSQSVFKSDHRGTAKDYKTNLIQRFYTRSNSAYRLGVDPDNNDHSQGRRLRVIRIDYLDDALLRDFEEHARISNLVEEERKSFRETLLQALKKQEDDVKRVAMVINGMKEREDLLKGLEAKGFIFQ